MTSTTSVVNSNPISSSILVLTVVSEQEESTLSLSLSPPAPLAAQSSRSGAGQDKMQGQAFALKVDPDAPQKEAAFRQDLNVRLVCPDCADDSQLVEEFSSGDLVCGNCGEPSCAASTSPVSE